MLDIFLPVRDSTHARVPGMVPDAGDIMEQCQALNNTHLHHNADIATQNYTPVIVNTLDL